MSRPQNAGRVGIPALKASNTLTLKGLEGGKGRVGWEGSGGDARSAAALTVPPVGARGGADACLIGVASTFLTGLCLMGGRGEDWVPKPAAAQQPENWRDERDEEP